MVRNKIRFHWGISDEEHGSLCWVCYITTRFWGAVIDNTVIKSDSKSMHANKIFIQDIKIERPFKTFNLGSIKLSASMSFVEWIHKWSCV